LEYAATAQPSVPAGTGANVAIFEKFECPRRAARSVAERRLLTQTGLSTGVPLQRRTMASIVLVMSASDLIGG
jgi:hypothetical protein